MCGIKTIIFPLSVLLVLLKWQDDNFALLCIMALCDGRSGFVGTAVLYVVQHRRAKRSKNQSEPLITFLYVI